MAVSLIPYNKKQRGSDDINIRAVIFKYKYLVPVSFAFLFLVLLYVGSEIWVINLENKVADVQIQKTILVKVAEDTQTDEVKVFAQKTKALQNILKNRGLPSQLFSLFEASVHASAVLDGFNLTTETQKLELSGIVPTFEILGQQFVIWNEESEFVKDVGLTSFKKNSAGAIEFDAFIIIKEGYLR